MCMYMIQSDRSDTTREHESTRRACTTCRAHGPHGRAMRACTRTAAARSATTTTRARAARRRRPATAAAAAATPPQRQTVAMTCSGAAAATRAATGGIGSDTAASAATAAPPACPPPLTVLCSRCLLPSTPGPSTSGPSTSRVAVASTCASRRTGTQWAIRGERLSAECGVRVRAMERARRVRGVGVDLDEQLDR